MTRKRLQCFPHLTIWNEHGSIILENINLIESRKGNKMRTFIQEHININPKKIEIDIDYSSALCSLRHCYEFSLSYRAYFTTLMIKNSTFFISYTQFGGNWMFFVRDKGIYSAEFCSEAILDQNIVTTDREDWFIANSLPIMVF
jgi:hypothetical protein